MDRGSPDGSARGARTRTVEGEISKLGGSHVERIHDIHHIRSAGR
jgi:hypothetical protein